MTIDHVGFFLIDSSSTYYIIARSVGRLAFPIFAFLIAEGFWHTKNFWRYFKRLITIGLIFELALLVMYLVYDINLTIIPFLPDQIAQMNIMWTLAAGLLALYVMTSTKPNIQLLIIPIGLISVFLPYSFYGLGLILVFGLFKDNQVRLASMISLTAIYTTISFFSTDLSFTLGSVLQLFALLALPIIFAYNGKKGKDYPLFFYLYYPIHILILMFIMIYIK